MPRQASVAGMPSLRDHDRRRSLSSGQHPHSGERVCLFQQQGLTGSQPLIVRKRQFETGKADTEALQDFSLAVTG